MEHKKATGILPVAFSLFKLHIT